MYVQMIKSPTEDDWRLVRECALVTVGRREASYTPAYEWKHRILAARHSPIRELRFVFSITEIPYWVAMHLARHHEGCQPYIRSQRNDRQSEYDRNTAPQNEPVDMIWSMNAEALMVIANKRLCGKAAAETHDVVDCICRIVLEQYPEFDGLLVPACRYTGGVCHEMKPCKGGADTDER